MATSPYATRADILRADAAVLDTVLTAHTVRHGGIQDCPANGGCEARQAIEQALATVRDILARETGSPSPQRATVTMFTPLWPQP